MDKEAPMSPRLEHLQETVRRYYAIDEASMQALMACCKVTSIDKGVTLYDIAQTPTHFAFLHKGLMRAFLLDEEGNEYNKNFFDEGRFPGCMSALLQQAPSRIAIQALEPCELVEIDFKQFRVALFMHPDLMRFHIHYLEKHWLLEKEPKEISYLEHEAKDRYQAFLTDFSAIAPRLPQYHIASYLGITPTQLSRIRKQIY
ncbi:Crp/Fnr family transcriptional regulator [Grimontia sp. AD028]|uniref:Crp/Fnr family transcriptional regulator n=1 Tax=Grimontia sp. AD028 TaxID=1581149 RepID=UPI001E40706E|nr:Crp/Fnr family transcriptional regulator [Grimontia sp. AD028]